MYTKNVTCGPLDELKEVLSSTVIPRQFPTESSDEHMRIVSDRELWRSCRIHRTIVTFVTLSSISSLLTTSGGVSSTECLDGHVSVAGVSLRDGTEPIGMLLST